MSIIQKIIRQIDMVSLVIPCNSLLIFDVSIRLNNQENLLQDYHLFY